MAPKNLTDLSAEEILNYKYTKAYIMGYMKNEDVKTKAEYCKQGEERPNGGLFKISTYNILYGDLKSKEINSQQDFSEVQFESEEVTGSIFDDNNPEKTQKTFQLHNKYIVNSIKSGMLIINQHRAHQRVLYEDFLQYITVKEAVSQQLLFPLKLEFSKAEISILQSLKEQLDQTGFMFSKLEDNTVELSGVPVSVSEANVSLVLEQLINDVENEVPDSNFSQTDLLAKSLAISLAIKTGQRLTIEEQEHLVNRLFSCKEPSISPTNKQTFVTMSAEDLDKKFM